MTRGTDWMRLISSPARISSRFRFFISFLMYSSWMLMKSNCCSRDFMLE